MVTTKSLFDERRKKRQYQFGGRPFGSERCQWVWT
jgi:hypothetical protein